MPKFYVSCGDLKLVIDRKTARQAAIDTFKLKLTISPNDFPENSTKIRYDLAELVKVGEVGFDKIQDEDNWFSAFDIAKEAAIDLAKDVGIDVDKVQKEIKKRKRKKGK